MQGAEPRAGDTGVTILAATVAEASSACQARGGHGPPWTGAGRWPTWRVPRVPPRGSPTPSVSCSRNGVPFGSFESSCFHVAGRARGGGWASWSRGLCPRPLPQGGFPEEQGWAPIGPWDRAAAEGGGHCRLCLSSSRKGMCHSCLCHGVGLGLRGELVAPSPQAPHPSPLPRCRCLWAPLWWMGPSSRALSLSGLPK